MKKYKVLILSIIGLWSLASNAQFVDVKTIKQAGKLEKDGIVRVANKHGNINITSWDKDSVVFEIKITSKSNSSEKMTLQLLRTDVEIHMSPFFTEATTIIDQSTISKEWKKVKKIAGYKDEQIQVMMNVKVPRSAKLEVSSSFGNVYMGNHDGNLEFNIKHGNLRAGVINDIETLDGNFSNIFIREANKCRANLSFSEFDIKKVLDLTIVSRNSRLDIELSDKIDLSTTSDRVDIKEVGGFKCVGKLSKINIEKVSKRFYASTKYGSINIKSFICNLQSFVLKIQSGSADIGMYPSCGANINAVGPSLTLNFNNVMNQTTTEGESISGTIGNQQVVGKIVVTGSQSAVNFYSN